MVYYNETTGNDRDQALFVFCGIPTRMCILLVSECVLKIIMHRSAMRAVQKPSNLLA